MESFTTIPNTKPPRKWLRLGLALAAVTALQLAVFFETQVHHQWQISRNWWQQAILFGHGWSACYTIALGCWVSWFAGPRVLRLVTAVGLVTLVCTVNTAVFTSALDIGFSPLFVQALATQYFYLLATFALLTPWRQLSGWRLQFAGNPPLAPLCRGISLQQLFIWLTLYALPLAMVRVAGAVAEGPGVTSAEYWFHSLIPTLLIPLATVIAFGYAILVERVDWWWRLWVVLGSVATTILYWTLVIPEANMIDGWSLTAGFLGTSAAASFAAAVGYVVGIRLRKPKLSLARAVEQE